MTKEAGPAVSMLIFKALEAGLSQKPSIFEDVCPLWEFVFQLCLSLGGEIVSILQLVYSCFIVCVAEERFKASVIKARDSACFPRLSWLQSELLHHHIDSKESCIRMDPRLWALVHMCAFKTLCFTVVLPFNCMLVSVKYWWTPIFNTQSKNEIHLKNKK